MSAMTNDPQRSITANPPLSKLARNQAMIERTLRPSFRDPMESFRKITERAAVPTRAPLIEAVASIAQTKLAPGIAALTKAQTGGLAAQLASPKVTPGMEVLTKALTAQMVGPKLSPAIAALTRAQTGGFAAEFAKGHSVASAIEGMRNVSERYAATTRALEPSRRPGNALMEAMKAFDADSSAVKVYDREAIKPLPPVRNFTADLVRLQHEATELRELERREEVDHRRQSLAVQMAMRDALIASEEARAAHAEASAKREMAALDRAIAAEKRAEASDAREAKMLRLTTVSVTIGGVSLLVGIATVIVTIIVAG